jgi:ABC-2 type transport system permease protein
MSPVLVLVRKDFANFFSSRMAVCLTFLVPFALIWLFGLVFGVNRKESGPAGIPLAVINNSTDAGAMRLVEALQAEKTFKVITLHTAGDRKGSPLREEDLAGLMRTNEFHSAVVIPADLISGTRLGLHLKIYTNPRNEIEAQIVNGMLQKTISTNVPQLLGESLLARGREVTGLPKFANGDLAAWLVAGGREVIGEGRMEKLSQAVADNVADVFGWDAGSIKKNLKEGNFAPGLSAENGGKSGAGGDSLFSQLIRIESIQVTGQSVKSPAATRIVGGWAMQFLLFSLSAAAAALFYERDRGIFHRILAGPVSRAQILWSKFIYGICIGMVQLLTLFVAGRILYGIDVEHHIGMLLLVCAFAAAACTAFGMLLAAISPSPEAAAGFATLLILVMCSIGGAWFPVTLMPEFIQQASKYTLVYWALEGFSQVLWAEASFRELLPTLGILGGMTAAAMVIAVLKFQRGKIFG